MPSYASSLASSLIFAAGLSSLGCASSLSAVPDLPIAASGTLVSTYSYPTMEAAFRTAIERELQVSGVEVGIVDSFLTDLNGDGMHNDVAGTAILGVDHSYKSFIYFMRDDGSFRFLENNGVAFDPSRGRTHLPCYNMKAGCRDTLERARTFIRSPSFSVVEFDRTQSGLEIVIPRAEGSYSVINSLALFLTT